MDISINKNSFPNSDVQLHKQRRKKSSVWEHFTIKTINNRVKALCNQCKKPFAHMSGSKPSGTSHLRRHINKTCPVGRNKPEKDQLIIPHVPPPVNATNIPRKRCRASNGITSTYFDDDSCTYDLAKMVIQHGYPLSMVEDSGFVDFVKSLQPQYNLPTSSLLHEQIMGIYLREKQKLVKIVGEIPGCVNLTVEFSNLNQTSAYVQITGQFTDHDWKLQRRVFLVMMIAEFCDSETAFTHAIAACLCDWAIGERLFSVTLDLIQGNRTASENLGNTLPIKNSHILEGQLLIKSCYAHTLKSLAQDVLASMKETVCKVRESVKYVKRSVAHEKRFIDLKRQVQVQSTKSLIIDDSTLWNTTYHMLVAACELKEVFSCLDTCDPDYNSTLSMKEWGQVETLCSYLKIFYEAANILTSPVYPTTNSFFDIVWKIYFDLLHDAVSQDCFVSTLTRPLLEIFTKYWDDCNLVLAIAVVMDPRFKMKFVEFTFSRIYGEDAESWIKIVDQGLHDLYLDYFMLSFTPPMKETEELSVPPQDELLSGDGEGFDFDVDVSDIMGETNMKSELEQYLEESVLPRVQDFDVLGWWRVNRVRFPTLSKVARDVLSIPVSTLSPESVFDSGERKVDDLLSSLRPKTVEALICAKDWLHHSSSSAKISLFEAPSQLDFVRTEL